MSIFTPNILFLDDDPFLLRSTEQLMLEAGCSGVMHFARDVNEAEKKILAYAPQVIVTDLELSLGEGPSGGYSFLRLLPKIAKLPYRAAVMTSHDEVKFGIRALELGAAHFITKPPDPTYLKIILEDGIRQSNLLRERDLLRNSLRERISAKSEASKKLEDDINYAATSELSVLLLGETGSGKSACALEIHRRSPRASAGRFVKYEAGLLNSELVASDLFGHTRGAFTGAESDRRGLIKEGSGGTFFLDELDSFPLALQPLLLGVLQDKIIRAVGSDTPENVDVRFISATNKEIKDLVDKKVVREDLLHRLGHIIIDLPPLRDRIEDVEPLAMRTLEELHQKSGVKVFELSKRTLARLKEHSWPGNIRELKSVIEAAALRADRAGFRSIDECDLRFSLSLKIAHSSTKERANEWLSVIPFGPYKRRIGEVEKQLISSALKESSGNYSRAAELLEMDRHHLRRIVAREGL